MNNVPIQRMVANYSNTEEYDKDGNLKGKPLLCMIRAYEQGIRDILNLVKQPNLNEWSEEDEKILNSILSDIETIRNNATVEQYIDVCNNKIDWLKSRFNSLKLNHWKPTEKQIEVLERYLHALSANENKEVLFSLYEDIKKLM